MGLCQAWLRFKSFCSGAIIFLTFSLLSGTWRSIRASSPAAPSILPWPHKKKRNLFRHMLARGGKRSGRRRCQPRGIASDGKCFCACSRCTRPQKCKKLFCPALPTCGKMPFGGLGREKNSASYVGRPCLCTHVSKLIPKPRPTFLPAHSVDHGSQGTQTHQSIAQLLRSYSDNAYRNFFVSPTLRRHHRIRSRKLNVQQTEDGDQ